MNNKIILDTETTGFNRNGDPYNNHSIIEIGLIKLNECGEEELIFHEYIKPRQPVTFEAYNVHGISTNFLNLKPKFEDIASKFIEFIYKKELIIHNAPFDVGFINYELSLIKNKNYPTLDKICKITDTLQIARTLFPGKKNSLDALCERFNIKTKRNLHGALIDAQILLEVYKKLIKISNSLNNNIIQYIDNKNITKPSILKTKKLEIKISNIIIKDYFMLKKYIVE